MDATRVRLRVAFVPVDAAAVVLAAGTGHKIEPAGFVLSTDRRLRSGARKEQS